MKASLLYLIFNRMDKSYNEMEPKRRLGFGDGEDYDDTEHTAYKRRRKRYVPTDSYNDDEYMEQTRRRRYGDNEQPRYDSRFNEGNRR